tara:strand:- start:1314 stop:1925 length:612 start_codon:yes stop_codon:yes gene_type:complete
MPKTVLEELIDICVKLIDIYVSGGWVLIPLFILSIFIFSDIFEFFIKIRNKKSILSSITENSWIENFNEASKEAKPFIINSNEVSKDEISRHFDNVQNKFIQPMNRQLLFLAILASSAPLMGLLGTVIGMLGTFDAISHSGGTDTITSVSKGIKEALTTTQTGLFIAIPSLFSILFIKYQKNSLEGAIRKIESNYYMNLLKRN